MKVETDAVLVVFWRWAEMVLRWRQLAGRSMCELKPSSSNLFIFTRLYVSQSRPSHVEDY